MSESRDVQAEARRARPWRPEDGPIRTRSWPKYGPFLDVWAEGGWRNAVLHAREDRRDGGVIYHVSVDLPSGRPWGRVFRSYWWDPKAIRPHEGPVVLEPWTAEEVARIGRRLPVHGGP